MIVLHTLRGDEFALNAELIERVEGETETHVHLVTGTSYVVAESEEEVIALHRMDRAAVQAAATELLAQREAGFVGPAEQVAEGASLRLVAAAERGERGTGR